MTAKETTEALMDRLAKDAKKHGRVVPWPSGLITLFALASSAVAVAIGLVIAGHALDLPSGDDALPRWWALFAAMALFTSGTVGALRLAVPGRAIDGTLRYLTTLSGAALLVALVGRSLPEGAIWTDGLAAAGWRCSLTVFTFAVAPLAMLAIAMRTGAPVATGRAALWASLAGVALALVATDLCCTAEHPAHLLVYHLGAAVLVATAASLALRRWLRW